MILTAQFFSKAHVCAIQVFLGLSFSVKMDLSFSIHSAGFQKAG